MSECLKVVDTRRFGTAGQYTPEHENSGSIALLHFGRFRGEVLSLAVTSDLHVSSKASATFSERLAAVYGFWTNPDTRWPLNKAIVSASL